MAILSGARKGCRETDVLENGVRIDGEQLYDITDPRGEFESTVLTGQDK